MDPIGQIRKAATREVSRLGLASEKALSRSTALGAHLPNSDLDDIVSQLQRALDAVNQSIIMLERI